MLNLEPFKRPTLSAKQRHRLLKHAERVLTTQQNMTTPEGKSILHHTLQHADKHLHMDHYPKGDRIDHGTGAQYFYHCHRENLERQEHGHFHCFLRYPQIPKRIKPKSLPDWDKYLDNPMTHIVAISMNLQSNPIRLFTVNRWVSSEIWYDAQAMQHILKRFKMTLTDDPYWTQLDQWIESILQLFSPQIAWLHHMRDLHVKQLGPSIYNDQSIEELSSIDIQIKDQIEWLIQEPQYA